MPLRGRRTQDNPGRNTRGVELVDEETVELMLKLKALNWGSRRIARELGCARNTVREYLRQGGWQPARSPQRPSALDGLEDWLRERFLQHAGNAEVVRQELVSERGIDVSLRTVERAVRPYRQELEARARATLRFETGPGEQLQIDFGSKNVVLDGVPTRVFVFVATLGYSRRCYVRVTRHERQSAWMQGLEGAFHHFVGVPEKVLVDNARALVSKHDVQGDGVVFNDRFLAFCKHWGVKPRACKPYRAQTKGKVESGVKYVKRNALAGREFASWEAMEQHLFWWMAEIADKREHGTTAEQPLARFIRTERAALKPLGGRVPFQQLRELTRVVHSDSCVQVDTNAYSVPWRFIRSEVTVLVGGGVVEILHAGERIAVHAELPGRRRRSFERAHLAGVVVGLDAQVQAAPAPTPDAPKNVEEQQGELQRALQVYEDATGGAW